ncbi:MAG: PadR family transcriptional regulator [candidate division Zixibacteria bacterium]|nr:PadR family transcriptional regulator [candidate division Zixibacteria bacterium]
MIYKNTDSQITNVELTLLQIIGEKEEISGYEINQIVIERCYRNWADIGTTSIYKGLVKLENKHLVTSILKKNKTGKGPVPRLFKLNKRGNKTLKDEILFALSNTNERDYRFDLGLAGLCFVDFKDAIFALGNRKTELIKRQVFIKEKLKNEGTMNLPFSAILVFKHPLSLIKNEIRFIDSIITQLEQKMK